MSKLTVEELDLLTFFECEPKRLDEGIPWPYNDFTYEYEGGKWSISFSIAPAYRDVRIVLRCEGVAVYELNAVEVSDVAYERAYGKETLTVDLNERDRLILVLKPSISINQTTSERT